jgi:cation:H+ antiporter
MMGAGILIGVFSIDGILKLTEGIVLNLLLIFFIWFSLRISRKQAVKNNENELNGKYSLPVSVFIIVGSSAGLALGARLLVSNASGIAQNLGISERAIAISMLAIGTSLPELVTSVIAAVQKETDISVGNIIVSNIFNIFSVLGITSIVKSIQVDELILYDIGVMLVISLILLFMIIPVKKGKITRIEGMILFTFYIIYMLYVFK